MVKVDHGWDSNAAPILTNEDQLAIDVSKTRLGLRVYFRLTRQRVKKGLQGDACQKEIIEEFPSLGLRLCP